MKMTPIQFPEGKYRLNDVSVGRNEHEQRIFELIGILIDENQCIHYLIYDRENLWFRIMPPRLVDYHDPKTGNDIEADYYIFDSEHDIE